MTNTLVIAIGKGMNNIVEVAKINAKVLYLPIDNCDFDDTFSDDSSGDIWIGIAMYEKNQKRIAKTIKDYAKIIILIDNISFFGQGFIFYLSKYIKRKNKKLIMIMNGNLLNRYYVSHLKKYGTMIDVYQDKKYKKYYKTYFPKVSLLELNGFINTVYINELKKQVQTKNKNCYPKTPSKKERSENS